MSNNRPISQSEEKDFIFQVQRCFLRENDIRLVMFKSKVSREKAIEALEKHNNEIEQTIKSLLLIEEIEKKGIDSV